MAKVPVVLNFSGAPPTNAAVMGDGGSGEEVETVLSYSTRMCIRTYLPLQLGVSSGSAPWRWLHLAQEELM
jgi:hypothetical protein